MQKALNKTQLEILKLLNSETSEEDLEEINSLIIAYLVGMI